MDAAEDRPGARAVGVRLPRPARRRRHRDLRLGLDGRAAESSPRRARRGGARAERGRGAEVLHREQRVRHAPRARDRPHRAGHARRPGRPRPRPFHHRRRPDPRGAGRFHDLRRQNDLRTEELMRTTMIALLSLVATASFAQWEPPGALQLKDDGGEPRVYYAHSYDHQRPNIAGLDDRISIHVQNFGNLLKQVNGNCANIVLFVDGMAIKGLQPESCDNTIGHVRYLLHRTEGSDDVWHKLLGSPHHYGKPVSISVGANDQFPVRTTVTNFALEAVPRFWFLLFMAI